MVSISHRRLDMHRCRGAPPHAWRLAPAIAALALAPMAIAGAQGIGYTLTPAAQHVSWADALGLGKSALYGAQASIDFDRALSLQGYYFQNGSVAMDVSQIGVPPSFPSSFANPDLRVRSYGANAVVNIGSGQIIPFLKAGGGVIDFQPSGGETSTQIALNAGGGLRFSFGSRIFLDFFAEDLMFRVDRFSLLGPPQPPTTTPVPSDPDKNTTRHNFVAGVGLGIPLGAPYQDAAAAPYAWGLAGTSFTIEPMYGHFEFADPANLSIPGQNMGGIRAGFDLGRYAGISGFYARDWNDGFDTSSEVETWGGEAQFRLGTGSGITPFLLAGGGSVQFHSGSFTPTTPGATFPDNKTSFILGGGLALPLDERLAIQLTARDFMYGAGNGIDSVASPSDLLHNWLFSAGLRFNIGGRSGTAAARAAEQKAAADRARADSLAKIAAAAARRDSILLAQARADTIKTPPPAPAPAPRPDTAVRVPTAAEFQEMMRDVVRTELSERDRVRTEILAQMALQRTNDVWLAASLRGLQPYPVYPEPVPPAAAAVARTPSRSDVRVPTTKTPAPAPTPRVSAGEVAVPPAAPPSPDSTAAERTAAMQSLRDSIRSDIRAELSGARAAALRQDTIVARLDSISKRLSTVEQKLSAPPPPPPTKPQAQGQRPGTPGPVPQPLTIYSGMSLSPGWQTVIGARYDIGALNPKAPVHIAPEAALGFFGGTTTFMGAANIVFALPPFGGGVRLHVLGGPGVFWVDDDFHDYDSGVDFVLNLGVGFTADLAHGDGARPQLFGELQGVDLFNVNRLLFGVKLGF
jgi:hypothetical protein